MISASAREGGEAKVFGRRRRRPFFLSKNLPFRSFSIFADLSQKKFFRFFGNFHLYIVEKFIK